MSLSDEQAKFLLDACKLIEYATKKMNEFRTQAFEILNSLNANPIHKKQLNLLVNFVIDRNV
jgi:geranylgeranyl pyrophosphate synthase